jgi:hypothetical protein
MVTIAALLVMLLLYSFAEPLFIGSVCVVYVFSEVFWWLLTLPFRVTWWALSRTWSHFATHCRSHEP